MQRSCLIITLFIAIVAAVAAAADVLPRAKQPSHQTILEHRRRLLASTSSRARKGATTTGLIRQAAHRRGRPPPHFPSNGAAAAAAASATQTVNASEWSLVGSVTIGTPPQRFTVAFRPWHSDAYFVGVDASVEKGDRTIAPKRYNQSASATAVVDGRNFTSDYGIRGHIVNDVLDLGDGVRVTVRFGVADVVSKWAALNYDDYDGVDAIIGLSTITDSNDDCDDDCDDYDDYDDSTPAISNVSVIAQLATALQTPILTTYLNRSSPYSDEWWGALTFGGEDATNCAAGAYAYAPMIEADVYDDHVAIASISLLNNDGGVGGAAASINTTLALSGTVTLIGGASSYSLSVTDSVFALFVNATGAVYNPRQRAYLVECARMAQFPRFRLNLGVDGLTPVNLYASDYIHHHVEKDACELLVSDDFADTGDVYIYLMRDFHNGHCVAEDLRERRLGFADVRRRRS